MVFGGRLNQSSRAESHRRNAVFSAGVDFLLRFVDRRVGHAGRLPRGAPLSDCRRRQRGGGVCLRRRPAGGGFGFYRTGGSLRSRCAVFAVRLDLFDFNGSRCGKTVSFEPS